MAFTNTGYIRSMKVTITKTGDDNSIVTTTYDGQDAFGAFTAIPDNDTFRRLERNGVDGDWDLRLAAFKDYLLDELGADIYNLIVWNNQYVSLEEYDIKIMAIDGTGGQDIIAIAYKNGVESIIKETISISFDTLDISGLIQIATGNYSSYPYSLGQADGTISDVSNAAVSPSESIYGVYSITVDTENTWQQ